MILSINNLSGVLYNDSTRMILHENGEQVQYLNKEMKEEMCLIDKYPSELKKKVSLITYFRKYMNDHLLKVSLKLYWSSIKKILSDSIASMAPLYKDF